MNAANMSMGSTGFPAYNNCLVPSYAMLNEKIIENCTWSFDAIDLYCGWKSNFDRFRITVFTASYWLCQTTLVPIGILGNALLFLTLAVSKMPGTTFAFLRLIALFLIGQALGSIGCTYEGYLFRGRMSHFWADMLGLRVMPTVMRMSKLIVCVLSAALTFDRYMALARPGSYSKVSERAITRMSLLASIIVGCLEMVWLAEVSLVQDSDTVQLNWLGKHTVYLLYVLPVILAIKVLVIISLIGFSVVIIRKLKERSLQVAALVSGDAAIKEYQHMVYLAQFQLIDMGMMIFDVGAASSVVHLVGRIRKSYPESLSCSFYYVYYTYRPLCIADTVLAAMGECVLAYAHGGLFIGYLACLKKFRAAFFDMRKAPWKGASVNPKTRT